MMESGKVSLPETKQMSWSHPRDIGQAMLKAATNPTPGSRVYLVKSFDATAEDLAREIVSACGSSAKVNHGGLFSKSKVPSYTSEQLKASLTFGDQASWVELGYKPQYDLKKTSEEVATWYKKEPWVIEDA